MMFGSTHSSPSSTARCSNKSRKPVVVEDWIAQGTPSQDLAAWTSQFATDEACFASRILPADAVHGEHLSETTRDAFLGAISELPSGPCRVWAFLPRPGAHDGDFLDRYMRFNVGRTNAYRELADRVSVVPAGTCVGHAGSQLVVHALWTKHAFSAIENPRQRPATLYSARYGPVPPAFTRATRNSTMLLASGTASVVGESSCHEASIDEQFAETIRNLDALAIAARASGAWRSLQIYVRDRKDLARVEQLAHNRFGAEVERILHAPICRRELLVEIEGVCDV